MLSLDSPRGRLVIVHSVSHSIRRQIRLSLPRQALSTCLGAGLSQREIGLARVLHEHAM